MFGRETEKSRKSLQYGGSQRKHVNLSQWFWPKWFVCSCFLFRPPLSARMFYYWSLFIFSFHSIYSYSEYLLDAEICLYCFRMDYCWPEVPTHLFVWRKFWSIWRNLYQTFEFVRCYWWEDFSVWKLENIEICLLDILSFKGLISHS